MTLNINITTNNLEHISIVKKITADITLGEVETYANKIVNRTLNPIVQGDILKMEIEVTFNGNRQS